MRAGGSSLSELAAAAVVGGLREEDGLSVFVRASDIFSDVRGPPPWVLPVTRAATAIL